MTWPKPVPGLVIRYAYLWGREAAEGREEGVKDRPCAIILVVHAEEETDGQAALPRVVALPITHTAPVDSENAVEIPAVTKKRLGLDDAPSWIVVTEANDFYWPGPDLRPLPGEGPESVTFGVLPPSLFRKVVEGVKAQRAKLIKRS